MLDIIDGLPFDLDGNLKTIVLSVNTSLNSFQLIDQCSLRNIPIIDTLRADRLKEVSISSYKKVLKKNRGYFEVVHISNQGKEKVVVDWEDNGAVIIASNVFSYEPIQKVAKWDQKEKKEVFVDMLYVVYEHDTSMGGTDRKDQNVNKYRIPMPTKILW